jgi:hypothetical protein
MRQQREDERTDTVKQEYDVGDTENDLEVQCSFMVGSCSSLLSFPWTSESLPSELHKTHKH